MEAKYIIYDSGQIQAADSAPSVLRHLCFMHNAFLESKDTKTAEYLKRAILGADPRVLEQVDILNSFYEDARITNGVRYDIDGGKSATLSGQLLVVSAKGGRPL